MSIKVFFSAFNIDDTQRKWGVRALFLLLSGLLVLALLFPIGNSDLTQAMLIYEKLVSGEQMVISESDYSVIINTFIYTLSLEFYSYILAVISVITAYCFISSRHPDRTPEHKKKARLNTFIACLFLAVIYTLLYSVAGSFYIIYAVVCVFLGMIGCCFISGDRSFGGSFKHGIRFVRENAPTCIVNFILLFMIFYFADFIVDILEQGNAYMTIVAALRAPLEVYKALVFGRMIGTIYVFGKK
ncbi:MAG: hypothetical protein K6F83_08030 [Clostridiales bacterium]|nr:hypothetical protein [Clostridiales bacterium]